MDLVDLIAEKRFLGQEFLAWLWYKSDERGGTIRLPSAGDIVLVFEKHLLLEYGEGEALEKVICQGLQAELREARTGLALGKKPEQARLRIGIDAYEYLVTVKGSTMEYRSVKLPKTMNAAEELDEQAAREGMLLDRIGLYERLVRSIDELFRMFIEVRTGDRWPEEVAHIRSWIQQGAHQE
ncbi:MAG: hypothetical protein AB1568_06685 [Thermodesulfobacteriota bacterium]